MQKIKMDKLDRKIISLLQADASLSAATIGEKIGLSQSPCWRRIQRLKDSGLMKEQGMVFDRKKLGFDTNLHVPGGDLVEPDHRCLADGLTDIVKNTCHVLFPID